LIAIISVLVGRRAMVFSPLDITSYRLSNHRKPFFTIWVPTRGEGPQPNF